MNTCMPYHRIPTDLAATRVLVPGFHVLDDAQTLEECQEVAAYLDAWLVLVEQPAWVQRFHSRGSFN